MPMFPGARRPRRIRAWLAGTALTASLMAASSAGAQTPAPSLSLSEALSRAAAYDPSRAALAARVLAGEAAIRQTGLKPNPSIGIELENFAGTGAYSLADRTEATVSYQQTLERGGKRDARTGLARGQLEVARWRGAVRALDVLRDVQIAYAEALAADAELVVAEARLVAAHGAQREVERRVKSARDPLFAGSRAEAVTAQAEIARDEARAAAEAARARLAAYWGAGANYSLDVKAYFEVSPPVAPATAEVADLQLLAAERDVAVAAIRVEQAKAVTDPTVRAGVRYLGQGDDVAFVVGGSIPLRRYDTNRAGVERAQAERTAAEVEIEAARLARERDIAQLTRRMTASARESERIRTEVIPAAIRAVEQVRAGFNRGGFQYLDVAEAERALFDARARRLVVLRQFHLDQAALDRVTGRHAALVTQTASAEPRR
ncbi:TolC family protein [uncultured Phenylobacterium sp.]|uniref:TolC family protein n=1 Tax=uncultured Phenylobacterium sp. TaxID=349273 RepID=UPI0025FD9F57|nr:TolC family protein [uncultured Phenylobacterium sp.]